MTVTGETELEWKHSGHGHGDDATAADLQPGVAIADLKLASATAGDPPVAEEIKLYPPA